MILALAALAAAHLPHDPVTAVAVPSGGAGPWFMVANPSVQSLILRSDDRGRTWAMVGGEPAQDPLAGVAWLDDGTLVVWAPDRLWWSVDQGASWNAVSPPATVEAGAGGATLRLATADGLWAGHPATGFTRELEGSWRGVGEDWAIAGDGDPWVWDGAAWVERPRLGGHARSIAPGGGWAGDANGGVWRWTGKAWVACPALPAAKDEAHPGVWAIAPDDDGVLVATGWRAPFRTDATCTAWTDAHYPIDPVYTETGGVRAESEAVTFLASVDGRWVVAGWFGFAWSDDGGATWSDAPLIPADYTRGLAFVPGSDRAVYVGGYAAGVARTLDGGLGFDAPGLGLDAVNVQECGVPEWGGAAQAWTVAGHRLWVSADSGRSWTEPTRAWEGQTRTVYARGGLDELWTFPLEPLAEGEPGTQVSRDGGVRWEADPELEALLGGAVGRGAAMLSTPEGAERFCLLAHRPVVLACHDGTAWTEVLRHDAEEAYGPFRGPGGDPTRWGVLDSTGWWTSADGGATWEQADLDIPDGVATAAQADDGTVFVATGSGGLWRGEEAGARWVDLGLRANAPIHVVAPRPRFAVHGDVLLGTHDGVRRVRGAGGDAPELVAWGAWQRIDDLSELLACVGCVEESVSWPQAGMDRVRRVEAGARLHAWVRGEQVVVVGASEGASLVELVVDGEVRATFGGEAVELGPLGTVEGLAPGWHEVELVAVEGSGVVVDALEGRGADVPFETSEDPEETGDTGLPNDTAVPGDSGGEPPRASWHIDRRWYARTPGPGCGCASGGPGPAWLAWSAAAAAVLRRRGVVASSR